MARIRAIKPEFWSSPDLPADPWARLLYIAMWNWADDNGIGTAYPRELLGFAFPGDEDLTIADARRMLVEIRRAFGVEFYTVDGRPYFSIPAWEKHQKFDRRSNGKYPTPDQAETWLYLDVSDHSAETHEPPSSARSMSVAGTGEQGNRGTGEQGNGGTETPQPPKGGYGASAPTAEPSTEASATAVQVASNARNVYDPRFELWWGIYPAKGRKAKAEAQRAWKTAVVGKNARISIDDLNAKTKDYAATNPIKYVPNAATWIRGNRWDDEIQAAFSWDDVQAGKA